MTKTLTAPVKGYKIFYQDWTCRDKQYTCPGEFKEDVKPIPGYAGMHFCPDLKDCFECYPNNPYNHCAEVIALGEIVQDGSKYATNHLQIIREIPWDEALKRVNQGLNCTGICNTGNNNTGNYNIGCRNTCSHNIGDWNAGYSNTGSWNTGDSNIGHFNTGNWNTGCRNTGNSNIGNHNTGNWNAGDYNIGDWNKTSFSNGVFCTEEPEILIFNKPSGMTLSQWRDSTAYYLLAQIQFKPNVWVCADEMTEEEKKAHPKYKTTGGFLKVQNTSDCCVRWWKSLSESDRDIIRAIPNFDAAIFKQITGIDA